MVGRTRMQPMRVVKGVVRTPVWAASLQWVAKRVVALVHVHVGLKFMRTLLLLRPFPSMLAGAVQFSC